MGASCGRHAQTVPAAALPPQEQQQRHHPQPQGSADGSSSCATPNTASPGVPPPPPAAGQASEQQAKPHKKPKTKKVSNKKTKGKHNNKHANAPPSAKNTKQEPEEHAGSNGKNGRAVTLSPNTQATAGGLADEEQQESPPPTSPNNHNNKKKAIIVIKTSSSPVHTAQKEEGTSRQLNLEDQEKDDIGRLGPPSSIDQGGCSNGTKCSGSNHSKISRLRPPRESTAMVNNDDMLQLTRSLATIQNDPDVVKSPSLAKRLEAYATQLNKTLEAVQKNGGLKRPKRGGSAPALDLLPLNTEKKDKSKNDVGEQDSDVYEDSGVTVTSEFMRSGLRHKMIRLLADQHGNGASTSIEDRAVAKWIAANAFTPTELAAVAHGRLLPDGMAGQDRDIERRVSRTPSQAEDYYAIEKQLKSGGLCVCLSRAASWEFDPFEFASLTETPLLVMMTYVFDLLDLFAKFRISKTKFTRLFSAIEDGYLDNPYHNNLHAADVVQNMYCFLVAGGLTAGAMGGSVALGSRFHRASSAFSPTSAGTILEDHAGSVGSDAAIAAARGSIHSATGLDISDNGGTAVPIATPRAISADDGLSAGPDLEDDGHRRDLDERPFVMDDDGHSVTSRRFVDCIELHDMLALLIAAAIHDFKHPGTNNAYQVNSSSALAIQYNDHSVLENMHLAEAFSLMRDPAVDIFCKFPKAEARTVRNSIIEMVLATDMQAHVDVLGHLQNMVKAKTAAGTWFDGSDPVERLWLCKAALHCADVANPTKPLPVYKQWAERILQEWHKQGDMEREAGLPISPMMDRNDSHPAKSQVGFIDYFIKPLYETWVKVESGATVCLDLMASNRVYWKDQIDSGGVATTSKK